MARPKTPILNQRIIVDGALEILRFRGDFTMSDLAAELGVRPSSLYNHVPSKSHVIHLLRSDWLGEVVDRALELESGPDRLRALMVGYYDYVSRVPNLVPLLATEAVIEPESLRFYDAIAACVREMGGRRPDVTATIALVDGFVLGSALDLLAPPFALDEREREGYGDLDWSLTDGRSTTSRGAGDFARGADIVIAGLVAGLRAST